MTDQSIDSLLPLAQDYHRTGRVSDAERMYKQIVAEQPDHTEAWYLLGILFFQTGRKRQSIEYLQKASASAPDNADILASLGSIRAELGDYESAVVDLRRATEVGADDPKPFTRLGMVLMETGRYEEAIPVYQRLNAMMPQAAGGLFNLGRAYEGLGRHEDAIGAYEQAIARKPNYADAYAGIAAALLDLDRPEEALEPCEQCLQRAPGDTYALALKAVALDALGERDRVDYLVDIERFVRPGRIEPPDGYDSVEAFNAALIEHISNHPTLSFDLPAVSCHNGVTSDNLLAEPKGPVAHLEEMLGRAFNAYRGALPDDPHPFVRAAPSRWRMEMWATLLDRQGHQSAHIHPTGWLSGVYYVQVPEVVSDGDPGHAGWIELGHPPDHFPRPKTPGLRYFRPEPGMFLFFPSYVYHRTVPFDSETRRVSIAFDFEPLAAG